MGWAFSGPPDTILLVLDRSASMEILDPVTRTPKRERAVKMLGSAAESLSQSSRLVLIDSATLAPQSLASAGLLADLSATGPTQTGASVPVMLQAAADYMSANQTGVTEVWIASDMQRTTWQPESRMWPELSARLAGLPQQVKVRLLSLGGETPDNLSVRVRSATRYRRKGRSELDISFEITRQAIEPVELPIAVCIDGNRQQAEYRMEGQSFTVHQRLSLGEKKTGGWGWVELPSDSNPTDDRAWFVYGEEKVLRAVVVSAGPGLGRLLALAAAPSPETQSHESVLLTPESLGEWRPDQTALLVWEAKFPTGEAEASVRRFIESGGVALFLPHEGASEKLLDTWSWGEAAAPEDADSFRIGRWDDRAGPLAKTASGAQLPLKELDVTRRRQVIGKTEAVAEFADGGVFLGRGRLGDGQVYFCATLPDWNWSSLGEGTVLVPMMQRLLQEGGKRLMSFEEADCGAWSPAEGADAPVSVEGDRDYRTAAGVYQVQERLVALNRPESEDVAVELDAAEVEPLFGDVSFQMLEGSGQKDDGLQSEVWRFFLCCVLFFMVSEGSLIVPGRSRRSGG
jgi:hypothetical protein